MFKTKHIAPISAPAAFMAEWVMVLETKGEKKKVVELPALQEKPRMSKQESHKIK